MTFTRDSAVWWIILLVSVAGYLSAHFELLSHSFPGVSLVWQSRLELLSTVGGLVSAYLRMSPLSLSWGSELANQGADPTKTLTVTGKP